MWQPLPLTSALGPTATAPLPARAERSPGERSCAAGGRRLAVRAAACIPVPPLPVGQSGRPPGKLEEEASVRTLPGETCSPGPGARAHRPPPSLPSRASDRRENRANAQHKTLEAKNTLDMWKKAYFDTRAKIEASGREARWEFDRKRLFERTDYMATICQDLYDVLQVGGRAPFLSFPFFF